MKLNLKALESVGYSIIPTCASDGKTVVSIEINGTDHGEMESYISEMEREISRVFGIPLRDASKIAEDAAEAIADARLIYDIKLTADMPTDDQPDERPFYDRPTVKHYAKKMK